MMTGTPIVAYFTALSVATLLIFGIQRWAQRLGTPLDRPILGALALVLALRPFLLALTQNTPGVPIFQGFFGLPTTGLSFIAPLLFLSLMLSHSMLGSARALGEWVALALILTAAGIILPLLVAAFGPPGLWNSLSWSADQVGQWVRLQVAGAASLAVSLYLIIALFHVLSMRLTGRSRYLRPLFAILVAMWLYATVYASVGYFGSEAWVEILPGEVINGTITVAMMTPALLLGWAYLERVDAFGSGAYRRWLSGVVEPSKEMERLESHLQMLASARRLILRSGSAEALLRQICELLVASGRYKAVCFDTIREEGQTANTRAAAGESEKVLYSLGSKPEGDSSNRHPIGDMLRHKRTVVIQDISLDPLEEHWRKSALAQGFRSAALLPVQQDGQVTACLAAYSSKSSVFDDYEVRLLQKLKDDLTYRLRDFEIEGRQLKRMKELEAMRDINAYMIAQPEIPLVLQAIVKKAANLLTADGGLMFLTETGERRIRCMVSYQTRRDMTGTVVPFGEGVAGAVAERGRPANISRRSRWQEAGEDESDAEIGSMLCAPMFWQGEVTGVLGLERGQGRRPFSDEELKMLTVFANQAAMVLQNARLIEDARSKVDQLEQLNALTRAAIGAPNISELGRILSQRLGQLAEAQGCLITLKDLRSGEMEIAATSGSLQASQQAATWARQITDKVLRTLEPQVVKDEDQLGAFGVESDAVGGVVALPLVAGQQGLGGAILTFGPDHPIQEGDVQIFSQAAIQAALALSKLQSIEAEQRRSSELETLRQASLSVTSILDLEAVLEAILAHTLRLLDADDAHIFIFEGDELTFGAALWAGTKHREPYSQPRKGGLTETVAHSGKRVIVPDVDDHELFSDWQWGGAIAGFPLRIGSRVLGVMNVAWAEPHDYLQEEIRAMELLADQAAIAIANVRLFEHMDAERQRVQLLYDVTNAIASSLDPAEILRRAVELATENFRAATGIGFVLEAESGKLKVGALANEDYFGEVDLRETLDLELGRGLEGWVAENKEPAMLSDMRSDERWISVEDVDYKDVRSVLSAPILAGVQTLGVITLLAESPFKPEQLELLQAIGQQVGLALSNARRYQMTVRQLRERTVLQQVAQVVTKRLEIQPLIREITRQVGQELGYPMVELYLVEDDELVLKASEGFEGEKVRIPLDKGVLGRVARTNQPALVPDVDQDEGYIPGVEGMKAEIAVPLRKADVVVGVLNVETPERYGLSQDDLRLLSLLADQVSIAMENAALYERLRQDAEKLEQTVAERTAALAEALEQAREANEIKTQFVSDVSHELRTPLTNIRLYLELLETGQPARFESYLDTLQRETDRLVTLIEDLLAISRLDAGTATPNPVSLDLNRLARSLVEDRGRLFSAKDLKLEFKPEAPLSRVLADERMLTQVVANLLTNALNYTRQGGRVQVSTGECASDGAEWVILTVRDTGLGIQPGDRERIFERFYRGSAAREEGKPGTGLGLAICKEILERHGGQITVESEPGKGSKFTIWLPKRPEPVRSQSWTGASGLMD